MRLLIVHPGADWSTADIHDGYLAAFKSLGHEVGVYNLAVRLARSHGWYKYNQRRAGIKGPPNPVQVIAQASADLVTAALRGDVDWVFVISGMYLDPDAMILLRRAGKRVALLLTESPYEDDRQRLAAQYADVVFTNERTSVASLREKNPNVYYLAHAYDPEKHHPVPSEENGMIRARAGSQLFPDCDSSAHVGTAVACTPGFRQPTQDKSYDMPAHDVVFVGTGFQERIEILSGVDWTGIDLGLYGTYDLLGSRSKLRPYIRGSVVDNAYAAALYRRAKIGLNLYRQSVEYGRDSERIIGAESMNPRALELAACGVFTLSDYRAEPSEVFGGLVPTFTSSDGLEALVRNWLADAEGRQAVAEQLPGRVARSTFRHRAAQVSALLMSAEREIIRYDGRTGESPAGAALGTRDACLVGV